MNEYESIQNANKQIQQMHQELQTLTLKGPHAGGSYHHKTGFRIAYLRAQIHVLTLQRNDRIKKLYSQFINNSSMT